MAEGRRTKRLSRAEAQARTRELLLDAARLEVVRRGAAASVRDIAETAGFSQGALYANFESKEAILLELLRRHMAEAAVGVGALLDGVDDGASALAALEKWTHAVQQGAEWAIVATELQLYANRSPDFAAEYEKAMAAPRDALGGVVGRLFALSGATPPISPQEIARGLLAMTHGLALDRGGPEGTSPGPTVMLFLKAVIAGAKRTAPK